MFYLPHWPIPSTLGNCQIDYETVFERMLPVLARLNNPHQKLPPVIHVAGTNGKGSTACILAKIFSCAGYKAHIYSSPHLHHCNERIILNGEKIHDSELFTQMEATRLAAQQTPLTFTEGFTIGALLAFSKTPADVLIVESNMGGRIDATNIIEEKLATVITPISFDHTEYLGSDIQRIALEKAMIMRPNTALIVASQSKQALQIIDILAKDQNIPTYYFDEDFAIRLEEETHCFDLEFFGKNDQTYLDKLPQPSLPGEHQYINCATSIATILAINEHHPGKFNIQPEHIKKALINLNWPSRLEKINNAFNTILRNDTSEIWIDGAHNEAGAFSLCKWLLQKKDEDEIPKKTFVIVGFSRGKCKKAFLAQFKHVIDEMIAITVDGEPYPETADVISDIARSCDIQNNICEDLLEAIAYIAKINNFEPCRIVICGSLHLARDVKKFSSMI